VREAWYLHRDQSDAYYFSNTENLTKRLATEAERAPQNKVDQEMRRRIEGIFEPKNKAGYQDLKALPVIDDVNLKGPRVLLILSPDTRHPPVEAQRFFAQALASEYSAVRDYNNALATFEMVKGTIAQHDNVVISEAGLPTAVSERAGGSSPVTKSPMPGPARADPAGSGRQPARTGPGR